MDGVIAISTDVGPGGVNRVSLARLSARHCGVPFVLVEVYGLKTPNFSSANLMNPKPWTLSPEPWTLNEARTLNLILDPRRPKPKALNPQPKP